MTPSAPDPDIGWLRESYRYELPPELIAQVPAAERDAARLLVVDRASGSWTHRAFRDLPELLDERDFLVFNDSRVMPARLRGRRVDAAGEPGGAVEALLVEPAPDAGDPAATPASATRWRALLKSSARQRPGLRLRFGTAGDLDAVVLAAPGPDGLLTLGFASPPLVGGGGELPLPGYIGRADSGGPDARDAERYQTVYARSLGSSAAPTAGLHFTPELLARLTARGIGSARVTLHVGPGTFRPVRAERIADHVMHEEPYEVPEESADAIARARRQGRRIVAVGTTSVRTLEAAWDEARGGPRPGPGRTGIFLHPARDGSPRPPAAVDRLLTNFHLPESTLLMLVSSLLGRDLALAAYAEAVRQKYRFFSYGDAMLIL